MLIRGCRPLLFVCGLLACAPESGDPGQGGLDNSQVDTGAASDTGALSNDTGEGSTGSSGSDEDGCTHADDDYCPESCPEDPDCLGGWVICPYAQVSYSGPASFTEAFEINAHSPPNHSVVIRTALNGDMDTLFIVGLDPASLEPGTYTSFSFSEWYAYLDLDRTPDHPLVPATIEDRLWLRTGTLQITSVSGRLTGTLRDAVFVDDNDMPFCQTAVELASFDAPIECRSEPSSLCIASDEGAR